MAKMESEKIDNDSLATSIIELAGLGTFDFDAAEKNFRSSKKFAEIFGFEHPVRFDEYMSRVHPNDEFVRESARQDINEGRSVSYEFRVVMPNHTTRWVRVNAKRFLDTHSQHHRWIGSIEDITKERRSYQALKESEAKFRTLITETPGVPQPFM